jgi:hypothetical protein
MPLTPNFDIYYRDTSSPASLETESALQADSVDDALVAITGNRAIQTFRWANSAARNAQTGIQAGDQGYQVDTGYWYVYRGGSWVPSNSPASLIVPTGQVNGSIDSSTGRVTVSGAASSVSILGGFLPTFRTHKITFDLTCGSAAALSFVFRASGSDVVTAYDWLRHHAANATDATSNAVNQASMLVGVNGIAGRHWGEIVINSAAQAEASVFGILANALSNPMTATTVERLAVTGLHRTATAYTDFSLIASAGSLTAGWVRVEGIV